MCILSYLIFLNILVATSLPWMVLTKLMLQENDGSGSNYLQGEELLEKWQMKRAAANYVKW